jgi:hypothetical protein
MIARVAQLLGNLALLAWVGGHVALGAFAARIVFRDLPRPLAAQTMTTIFRSFDGLIAACIVLVLLSVAVRAAQARTLDLAGIAALALCAVGVFELAYVSPAIDQMFRAGRTLEPEFASVHRLSERCGHLEVALAALILGAQAWR